MISNPQHALTFGALNLIGTDADQAANGYQFQALGDDRDWGNPVPIEQKITSWLQDGAIVALTGQDNRQMFLRIQVLADDSNGLALAEQALMFESYRRNLLTWTPPDGAGEPCVFTVVMSSFDEVTDDLDDLRVIATYGLKIQALPYVRSQDMVTATRPAPPTSSVTVTSIDTCTSTTGWTGSPNAPSTSGGAVRETKTVAAAVAPGTMSLLRSGLSVNMAASPFLRLDIGYVRSGVYGYTVTVKINGSVVTPAVSAGHVSWYQFAGTLNSVEVIVVDNALIPFTTSPQVYVADISRSTATADVVDTGRQVSGTLAVAGSVRAEGNLAIFDPSDSLGDVLIYTSPANPALIQPNLRTWLQAGPTPTPDATTVSGTTTPLATLHYFNLPVSGVAPGGYLLLARVQHASTGAYPIFWTASGKQGSNGLPNYQQGDRTVGLTGGVWQIVTLGNMVLPPTKMGSAGTVLLTLGGPGAVKLDEAWLFNTDTGNLTQVAAGSGTVAAGGPANRLWIDAPSLESPTLGIFLGTQADRSDSFHASSELSSPAIHEMDPPLMNIFSVTTKATASVIELSQYRNFHTRVTAP